MLSRVGVEVPGSCPTVEASQVFKGIDGGWRYSRQVEGVAAPPWPIVNGLPSTAMAITSSTGSKCLHS